MTDLAGYYNRFDSTKNYESLLFRSGKVLQSAELNDWQSTYLDRMKRVTDQIFSDGSIISDAGIQVNSTTGVCLLAAGALYLRGAVRGVAPATVTVAITGTVQIGIWLLDTVITEVNDGTLLDPAIQVQNYGEPGAGRLEVTTRWGLTSDTGGGTFYPVYTVINGVLVTKDAPPSIDAVAVAIARYDRESAGGFYVASGFLLTKLADSGSDQVYTLSEGVARINGSEIATTHAQRLVYTTTADLKQVNGEPHVMAGGTERINPNHSPINAVQTVLIQTRITGATVVHGTFSGCADTLPHSPVMVLVSVTQGGTTYHSPADFLLTGDTIDWSPSGAEPATGSTYTVTYDYIATVTPTSLDATGFTVTGAVTGSLCQVTYNWMRPRIDRLVLDGNGTPLWIRGIASDTSPVAPAVPGYYLEIAQVYQSWDANRLVTNDSARTVPMADLNTMQGQIDTLYNLMSYIMLNSSIAITDPSSKKGIFVDPFNDDNERDVGLTQNGAVGNGILTLPISNVNVTQVNLSANQTLPINTSISNILVQQTLRTSAMAINPYDAFTPIPATITLAPAVDYWQTSGTVWSSTVTNTFVKNTDKLASFWGHQFLGHVAGDSISWGNGQTGVFNANLQAVSVDRSDRTVTNTVETLGIKTKNLPYLRSISVSVMGSGFGAGEILDHVIFDGVNVSFS